MDRDSRCRRRLAECLFPLRIISRLFRRVTARKPAGESNPVPDDQDQVDPPPPSPPVLSPAVRAGGNCNKETAVNLGVACSLFYLTAASKNELEEMMELRKEMGAFLQEIKAELHGKDRAREPGGKVVAGSPRSCLTDAEVNLDCSSLMIPFVVEGDESTMGDWPRGSGETRQQLGRMHRN